VLSSDGSDDRRKVSSTWCWMPLCRRPSKLQLVRDALAERVGRSVVRGPRGRDTGLPFQRWLANVQTHWLLRRAPDPAQ